MPRQYNAYKGWTHEEVERLRAMFGRGLQDEIIASRLSRTARSVAVKRHKLGLVHRRRCAKGDSLRTYADTTLAQELRRRGYVVSSKPRSREL